MKDFFQPKKINGMMKTKILVIVAVSALFFLNIRCKQKVNKSQQEFRNFKVAFYNVENLFDTINQDGSRDGEFTPQSELKWNTEKYNKKIENTAKVLWSIDSLNPPAIIGLCEVENRLVLEDLVKNHYLRDAGYAIVHHESPDERGIDVAVLYRSGFFKIISDKKFVVNSPDNKRDHTRDLLYVKGVTANSDTLHLLVDHWASRLGGTEKSDKKRKFSARLVKKVTDSIFKTNQNPNIIFMGDLNDNPTDSSVAVSLKAKKPVNKPNNNSLYNLALQPFQRGEGTLFYKGWNLFDQIIVSGNILKNNKGLKINPKELQIFNPDWILYEKRNGSKVPNRTGSGKNYSGGYSDHLPVYINFH